MEPACQDHSCTLNTWKSIPKIAGFITVYLVAVCNRKFIAVCVEGQTNVKSLIVFWILKVIWEALLSENMLLESSICQLMFALGLPSAATQVSTRPSSGTKRTIPFWDSLISTDVGGPKAINVFAAEIQLGLLRVLKWDAWYPISITDSEVTLEKSKLRVEYLDQGCLPLWILSVSYTDDYRLNFW